MRTRKYIRSGARHSGRLSAGFERILFEKESGMKHDRSALKRLLRRLHPGDVVIVPALDRLTREGAFRMLGV